MIKENETKTSLDSPLPDTEKSLHIVASFSISFGSEKALLISL